MVRVALRIIALAGMLGASTATVVVPAAHAAPPPSCAVSGNLVQDCSFESPQLDLNGHVNAYMYYTSGTATDRFGDTTQPWVVQSGSVDLDKAYPLPHSGTQALDLNGHAAGTLTQDVPTQAAHT